MQTLFLGENFEDGHCPSPGLYVCSPAPYLELPALSLTSHVKPIEKYLAFKGTVQRKLTGVLSGINRKLMICHCSDGCSFFNLKGLRSLNSKNMFSALTGALL
jgi:hypothetical protein